MTSQPVHLKIISHPGNLRQVRCLISDVTAEAGLPKETAGSIILAVDEACSNIIRHGYQNDHTREIHVTIERTADFLTISIKDHGIEFDIESIKARNPAEIKPGGLGVYIIYEVMDQVEYCRTKDGCNQIKMIKRLKA